MPAAPPAGIWIKINDDLGVPGSGINFNLEVMNVPAANNIVWTLPANLVGPAGGTANKFKISVSGPTGTYEVKCVASLFSATGEGNWTHEANQTVVIGAVPVPNPNPLPPIND